MPNATAIVRQQLAPEGVLRAAINLSNSLLVSGKDPRGWRGVAVDLGRLISERLGVDLELVPYATPPELLQHAGTGAWTIAMVGADPARAGTLAFTAPYAEIVAGYLVPAGSTLRHAQDVDRCGHKVVAFKGSAYGIWLERHLQHATLVNAATFEDAFKRFRDGGIDALASLMPKLQHDESQWPGTRILEGAFMTVRQAIGTSTAHQEALAFLEDIVEEIRRTRMVARWIANHQVRGLAAT